MRVLLALAASVLMLSACAPATTVEPIQTEELVSPLPFREAFTAAVNAINTQPYPSDSGGWIITDSDQVGGFVSAQLNGSRCVFWGCYPYMAQVSVAFIERSDGTTAVNISVNRHEEAAKLADSIRQRLQL